MFAQAYMGHPSHSFRSLGPPTVLFLVLFLKISFSFGRRGPERMVLSIVSEYTLFQNAG
jgi:hypothetical protein